ncbi:unannotated protein [freshwater metagenome]|uniref:Unannotated protein n=1 Tax=freshwater metagenome TaxID=449393 RepID=A0A6J6IWY9_9ZZZZ
MTTMSTAAARNAWMSNLIGREMLIVGEFTVQ